MCNWRKVLFFFVCITPILHILKHHANTLTHHSHTQRCYLVLYFMSRGHGCYAKENKKEKKGGGDPYVLIKA